MAEKKKEKKNECVQNHIASPTEIANECLVASSGAFKPSPAASLNTEEGILPLECLREAVSLKFFFNMKTHPESLT